MLGSLTIAGFNEQSWAAKHGHYAPCYQVRACVTSAAGVWAQNVAQDKIPSLYLFVKVFIKGHIRLLIDHRQS
jgi:hypothetical protein